MQRARENERKQEEKRGEDQSAGITVVFERRRRRRGEKEEKPVSRFCRRGMGSKERKKKIEEKALPQDRLCCSKTIPRLTDISMSHPLLNRCSGQRP